MRIQDIHIIINKAGYVTNEDEVLERCEEVEAITEPLIDMMKSQLKAKGYEVIVK